MNYKGDLFIKKLNNNVKIVGTLVDCTFEVKENNDGKNYISGDLILRTEDGSEHKVQYFANEFKKDSNEKNKLFDSYKDFADNCRSIKNCEDDDAPDVINISEGMFFVNDYKDKSTGKVRTSVNINSKFINFVSPKMIDTVQQSSKFEIDCIINNIEDEIKNDEPTGNLTVSVSMFRQIQDGFGRDVKYEISEIFPMTLTVDNELSDAFKNYYSIGCIATLQGEIINKADTEEQLIKHNFGESEKKVVTTYTRQYLVKSGDDPIYDLSEIEGLSSEVVAQLESKRKIKLQEIMSGVTNKLTNKTAPPTRPHNFNPFLGKSKS